MSTLNQSSPQDSEASENVSQLSDAPEQENSAISSSSQKSESLESIKEENEEDMLIENSIHSLDASDLGETEENGNPKHKSQSFKLPRQVQANQLKGSIRYKYQEDILQEIKKQSTSKNQANAQKNLKEKKPIKKRFKTPLTVNTISTKQRLAVISEADCEESAVPQALKRLKPAQIIQPRQSQ